MEIVDLTEDRKEIFCLCLEDWSADAKEAGPRRRQWLDRSEKHGLRERENQKHWTVHLDEFFDHHLMDKPAPGWLKEGVPHLKLDEHIGERL